MVVELFRCLVWLERRPSWSAWLKFDSADKKSGINIDMMMRANGLKSFLIPCAGNHGFYRHSSLLFFPKLDVNLLYLIYYPPVKSFFLALMPVARLHPVVCL